MNNHFIDSDIHEITNNLGNEYQKFSGKKILITGGNGFLGQYFIAVFHRLNSNFLSKPCSITIMDNLIVPSSKGFDLFDDSNIQFINHDVIEEIDWDGDLDIVIHAAGIASPYYYRAYPMETLKVSTVGCTNMLELARQHQARFIFFSSSEIYGDPDPRHVPTSESYRGNVASMGPRACYDESKRLGETLCYIYHTQFGLNTNVIRPFNIYGPGMSPSDYRVIPNFGASIKLNEPLRIYGNGKQTRTYCYISDALTGFLKTIINGVSGEPYNIGNNKPEVSVLELVQAIEKVLECKVKFDIVEHPDSYPSDEPMRRCPDIRKAKLQLNYQPNIDLEEGLSRFLSWSEQHYPSSKE